MPELPEVEHTRRQLRRTLEGRTIVRVLARRPDLRYPLPRDFVARLEGVTVRALSRRAKYLLAQLSTGDLLLMHLGMSGSFRVLRGAARPLLAHDHVVFELSSGAAVVFNDPRRFGSMTIVDAGGVASDRTLSALGPEPLSSAFTAAALAASLRRRRRATLKAALSDQRVVAGLGNIYVCEALHRAGLSPRRRASSLIGAHGSPRPPLIALVAAIRQVLRAAIAGSPQLGGADRFRVYDREGRRCLRRGCSGRIRRIVQTGRATFFCPVCQR